MHYFKWVATLFWGAYAGAVCTLFFSVADQPLARAGILPVGATTAAVGALLPFLARHLITHTTRHRSLYLFTIWRRNSLPLFAFLSVATISIAGAILPGSFWGEGGKWIFLCSYGFVLTLLAHCVGAVSVVARYLPLYTAFSLVLLLTSLWYDMSYPGTFSELNNRAAGFPGNANFAALVSVMLCSVSLTYNRLGSAKRDAFFLVITAVHVLGTMSRSGLLNYGLMLALYLYFRFVRDGLEVRGIMRFTAALAASVLFAGLIALRSGATELLFSAENRLTRFASDQQVDDGSAASRLAAAKDSLRLINASPVLGHGTGHARTMAELPHNLYLQQWVNNGVLGLISYVLLLGAAWYTFYRRGSRQGQTFIAVTALGSVFSHNILDQRPFLLLLGIVLVLSVQPVAFHIRSSRRDAKPDTPPGFKRKKQYPQQAAAPVA